ncbi:MAG: hypothetical protein ABR604_05405 [Jatrophihabitantaceae bacterium]
MSRDDVEFLAEEGPVGADDDIVEFGRRRVPRSVTTLAGLAVASVIVASLAAQRDRPTSSAHRKPAPSITASRPAQLPPVPGLGRPLPLPTSPVVDAVVSPGRLYTLQFSQLTLLMAGGPQQVSPDGLDFARIGGAVRLVLDVAANRLWIVVVNTPDGGILEFEASTLRRLRHASWAQPIAAATTLHGVLYFSTPSGVAAFPPGAKQPAIVPALRGQTGVIVADPRRSRLLVLDYAMRSRVRAYVPGSGLSDTVGEMSFGKGTVVVTGDGEIWAGGFGNRRAVLTRLDPTSLRPAGASPLASRLGPGAVVVAAGQSDIFVRNGSSGTQLFCVNGESGSTNQQWSDLPGRVTSRKGESYVVSGTALRPLITRACTG